MKAGSGFLGSSGALHGGFLASRMRLETLRRGRVRDTLDSECRATPGPILEGLFWCGRCCASSPISFKPTALRLTAEPCSFRRVGHASVQSCWVVFGDLLK